MSGLFPDGETLSAKVWTDFIPESDLQVGRVVILRRKKKLASDRFGQNNLLSPQKNNKENNSLASDTLIIHRLVSRFCLKNQLLFWEKGDNDYFPKICQPEEIAAIVLAIEGQPELSSKLQPDLWQKRNQKLLKFYAMAGRIYTLIETCEKNQRNSENHKPDFFYRASRWGFWCMFHFLCSLFNLKGS